jgi:L-malate glycosyltransferase
MPTSPGSSFRAQTKTDMNILVVTSTASSFNSLRPEAEMFIGFVQRGHSVTIATQSKSQYGRIFKESGIRVIDCHPRKKLCLRTMRQIRSELKNNRYDVLYLTNSKAIPNGAFAAMGLEVNVVSYRGTTGGLYRHDPSAYLTHLHPRINGIVCVSEAVRADVAKRVWKNRAKVVAIHKGHNIEWYQEPPADLSVFGIKKNDFKVICAVNARPSKGIPVMLEAIDFLADIEDLHLLLVGKNMDMYSPLIRKSKMTDRIHLTGYRYDAPQLIASSSVLVQPSISGEGLPRAVMEAMGYGIPCVVTDTGGGKEVVEDGVSGFVVPTNNPQAIAAQVRYLHDHPERARDISSKAKERLVRGFSCNRSTELYLEYFSSLLSA